MNSVKKMKKSPFIKGLAIMLAVLLATGCSLAGKNDSNDVNNNNPNNNNSIGQNEQQGQPEQGADPKGEVSENELSPKPEDAGEPVKETVTLYFADSDLMDMFRVEKEVQAGHKEDIPKAALEAWMKGPEQEGLTNLVPPEVVIEKLEYKDGIAHVSFSKEIRNANLGSGGEMFLIQQITLIMKQFGYNATQILVEGQAEESILGHVTTNKPIPAEDPEKYEWFKK